jgi:hypothetical protein
MIGTNLMKRAAHNRLNWLETAKTQLYIITKQYSVIIHFINFPAIYLSLKHTMLKTVLAPVLFAYQK